MWRRPLAMAAQAAVLLAAVLGVWLLTRPQPAIAFAERDWVVLGGLHNLTGNRLLDDALDQAFRISLEQSRYVNVVSDDRVGRTLEMMRKPLDGGLRERGDAAAVAVRTGARLVFVPSATDIGGRTRFSVEVVEPSTLRTLAVVSADAKAGAVLAAVDDVSRQLRDRLGEEPALIQRDSQSLPEVTTGSMDALRAFALGQKRYSRGDFNGAMAFFEQAIQVDPEFALAWLGQARCRFAMMNYHDAKRLLEEADRRSGHLTPRERLYVQNWALQIGDPDRATDGWARMAELYPDYMPASYNAGLNLFHENRLAEALALSRRVAHSRVELPEIAQDQYGRALLASERYADADIAFSRAASNGWEGALMRQATVAAARAEFEKANALLGRIDPNNFHAGNFATTIALDQGDVEGAIKLAEQGRMLAARRQGMDRYNFDMPLAVAYMMAGRKSKALMVARASATAPFEELSGEPAVEVVDRLVAAHAAALLALRLGDAAPAKAVQARMNALQDLPDSSVLRQYVTLLAGRMMQHEGRPQAGLDLLVPLLKKQPRLQVRLAVRDLALEAGLKDVAHEQTRWLRDRPGFAYAEAQCSFCLQALNVVDVRRLMAAPAIEAADTMASMPQRSVRGEP
ncbi:putative peptide modification system cyclase [Stenotrophomonas maltophilia]|uniref:putative peptide modification system cyclase n=1 Tax=Stenotrophomonas maltophilia TaxID=40324 RepID=UPI003D35A089